MKTETQALRDKILTRLLNSKEQTISGTALSEAMGVSRTAVWKHIQSLEQLGCKIESAPKTGYRLTEAPDALMEPLIWEHLNDSVRLGRPVIFSPTVDSTNRLAQELALAEPSHGALVTAQEQTMGRGRRGKVWFSHPGGAWFSLVLQRPIALNRAFELTLLASVALRRAITHLTGVPLQVKWPNDLLVNGRKVCGILAEIRSDGEQVQQAIIGVGINANVPEDEFPSAVREIATSLSVESGQSVNRAHLVADFLSQYQPMVEALCSGQPAFECVHDEWCKNSHTLGRTVRVRAGSGVIEGRAERLETDGTLILVDDAGHEHAVQSGEVLF